MSFVSLYDSNPVCSSLFHNSDPALAMSGGGKRKLTGAFLALHKLCGLAYYHIGHAISAVNSVNDVFCIFG